MNESEREKELRKKEIHRAKERERIKKEGNRMNEREREKELKKKEIA